MNARYGLQVTAVDVVGGFTTIVLLATTFYFAGVCNIQSSYEDERWRALRAVLEEHEACERAISECRGSPWTLVPGRHSQYDVVDAE